MVAEVVASSRLYEVSKSGGAKTRERIIRTGGKERKRRTAL